TWGPMTPRDPFTKSDLFQRAVRRILRPLVRALIAQGVTAPAFYRIVKQAYIEGATEDLGPSATDSRVSVITGIHRRDVKAFRSEQPDDSEAVARKTSTLATVVGRWLANPDLNEPNGTPRPLPRSAEQGPSFEALVQGVSRDIRPRAILDELVHQGLVEVDGTNVILQPEAVLGPADLDQQLHYFSTNIGDHMSASVENLLSDYPPFLERALFYNNLTQGSVDELEVEARRRALELLTDLNALAAARQKADTGNPSATNRLRLGIYFYKEDEGDPSDGTTTDKDGAAP
ncbi:MAG: DUF6502 family protein, partial [Pseudomonadota bacterium]